MADKEVKQRQELTPELREKRSAVRDVRGALDDLQKEVQQRRRTQEKDKNTKKENTDPQDQVVLGALLDAWKNAVGKNGAVNSPEWKALQETMGSQAIDKLDIQTLLQNLEDSPELEDVHSELANLSGDLGDEMLAADKYLETFPKAPLTERIWDQVEELIDKKMDSSMRDKLKDFGFDAQTLRMFIVGFLAGIAEGFALTQGIGKSLRFRVVLEQARVGDAGDAKREAEKAIIESLKVPDANTEPIKALEAKWLALYNPWMLRKRNATQGKYPFTEPVPSIHDALHPPAQPKTPEGQPKALFGIAGFERGKEMEISGVQTLNNGETTVAIDMQPSQKTLQLNGGQKYSMQLDKKEVTRSAVFSETDPNKGFRDIKVRIDGNEFLLGEIIDVLKAGVAPLKIARFPNLTFEKSPA